MARGCFIFLISAFLMVPTPSPAQEPPRAAGSGASTASTPSLGPGAAKKDEAIKPSVAPPSRPEPAQAGGTSATVLDLNAVGGVLGMSVKSYKGEDLGHIVDLLVTSKGDVRAAVIDFGGVLGVGSRKVAVDWKALSFAGEAKGEPAILALTRDQVRVSPEYKSGDPVVILEAGVPTKTAGSVKTPGPVANPKIEPPPVAAKAPSGTPTPK